MKIVIGTNPSLDEIVHYGVKGMHWGVRKDRDRSSETRSQRNASAKSLQNYMWNAVKNEPIWNVMTEGEYKSLSNKGENFAKNTTLRRITPTQDEKLKGAVFVSTLLKDSEFYRAAIPAAGPNSRVSVGGQKEYKQKHYELTIKATKKLSSPSEKERVDAFMELIESPSIKLKGKDAPVTGRAYLEKMGYKPYFKQYATKELALNSWKDFARMQGDRENPLAQAYFDKLRSKGYNAVIDDNDRGRFVEKPLIVLDPDSALQIKSVRQLTTDEINQAQRNLSSR